MSGTIIGWHLGDVGPRLAAQIPGWRYVAATNPQGAMPLPSGRVCLVGYSLGCVGLRETLRGAKTQPEAVVTIDGTHSSKGKGAVVSPSHLAVWRPLAERAKRGECLWLATTLGQHRYVERMGDESFASTGKVLEAVLGLQDGALRTPQAIDNGGLHVRSYASADMDKAAHAAQVRDVLPALWRDVVVPFLSHEPMPDIEPAPAVTHSASSLGLRCLAIAREQLAKRVAEVPGAGTDPQVAAYLYPCRRGGTSTAGILDATGSRLGLADDDFAWCAAFASFCLALAIDGTDDADREACPHGYRAAVAELVRDAKSLGTWREPAYRPSLGDLAIWRRGGGDPRTGGTGHVARVSEIGAGAFKTIDGNSANSVRETAHRLDDPELVGWIVGPAT